MFLADSSTIQFGADQDTTLTHTDGAGLTLNSTNKLMFNDASQFIQGASATVLDIAATDEIELTATLIEVVGNATVSGTLGVTGVTTSNAGVVVDNITIDGTEIDLSSGDLLVDVAGDITLDAGGGNVKVAVAGTDILDIANSSGNLIIESGSTTAATFSGANVTLAGTVGSGAITSSGLITSGAGLVIADAGNIGSASDTDAIAIGSDGDVTLTQDLELQHDGAILSFGANDEISLTHVHDTGLLLNSTSKLQFNDASQFIQGASATVLDIAATDEIELTATLIEVVGNATVSGTLGVTGVTTSNAGVVVDNITIDGTEIDLSSGDLLVDVAGDITLDAGGGNVKVAVAGTDILDIANSSSDVIIKPVVDAKDIIFQQSRWYINFRNQ